MFSGNLDKKLSCLWPLFCKACAKIVSKQIAYNAFSTFVKILAYNFLSNFDRFLPFVKNYIYKIEFFKISSYSVNTF